MANKTENYVLNGRKLVGRSWADLFQTWEQDLLEVEDFSAEVSVDLKSLPSLAEVVNVVHLQHTRIGVFDNVAGMRVASFHHSLGLFQKALNAYANETIGIDRGFCSWSIVTAYQSAFFAAKAIMGLVGVVTVENKIPWLIDLFAERKTLSKALRQNGEVGEHQIRLIGSKSRNWQHQPIWHFLKRTIAITDFDGAELPIPVLTAISELEIKDFAKGRNKLLYNSSDWPFPADLLEPVMQDRFGCFSNQDEGRLLNSDSHEFSIRLSTILIGLCILLFKNFEDISPYWSSVLNPTLSSVRLPHQARLSTELTADCFNVG